MKFLPLLLALILYTSTSFAQIGWFEQASGGEDILFCVDLLDASTVTAVGEHGLILHSTDGGATWSEVASGTSSVLRRIRWHSPTLGVILGNDGTALKSTDAGQSWRALSTGVSDALFDVYFHDDDNWLVVGHGARVLTTTDGGASFTSEGSGLNNYQEITMHGDFGFIVGNAGTIRLTNDGGESWKKSKSPVGLELTSVSIANDSTAVAVGINGTIIRTTNGGGSWVEVSASIPISSYRMTAVRFLTPTRGVIAGYGGIILESDDAGASWTPQQSNSSTNIESMSFVNNKIGNTAGWNRTILRTTTGGTLGIRRSDAPAPAALSCTSPWPNPLSAGGRGTGHVTLRIPSRGTVTLRVYDLLGRERTTVLQRMLDAGTYTSDWQAGSLGTGVYLLRLTFGAQTVVRRFTVLE